MAGECRDIPDGGFRSWTNDSLVVSCGSEHSAETAWVGEVALEHRDDESPPYAAIAMDAQCDARVTAYLGTGDWLATRLVPTVFVAPLADWVRGARWVRCDLYLPELGQEQFGSADPLVGAITLDDAQLAAYRLCTHADPDDPYVTSVAVACDELHDSEAFTPTADLSYLGERYPGEEPVRRAADAHCLGELVEFVGGEADPAIVPGWTAPDRSMWESGDHIVVCEVRFEGGRVAGSVAGSGTSVEIVPYAEGEDDPDVDPDGASS